MNLKTNYFQLQLDEGMWQYIPTFCDRESLTCDIDSDPTGIPVPVRSRFGGIWAGTDSGPVPVDLAGTRPIAQFFHVVL